MSVIYNNLVLSLIIIRFITVKLMFATVYLKLIGEPLDAGGELSFNVED